MLKSFMWRCVGFVLMALFLPGRSVFGEVVAYHPLHDSEPSTSYAVTVNGQPVPVQRYKRNSYVWFAFSGTVAVEVTVNEPVLSFQLSPLHYEIPVEANGAVLSFVLDRPRKLVLRKVNALREELFIFGDSLEGDAPILGAPDVIDCANILRSGPARKNQGRRFNVPWMRLQRGPREERYTSRKAGIIFLEPYS